MKFGTASKRRRDEMAPRLPLVAFIDVVLFLLLYFLMAGNLASQEAELASGLRAQSNTATKSNLADQIVQVSSEGGKAVFLVGQRRCETRGALAELLRQLPKDPGVFIKVSGEASVEAAAAALQAATDAGFTKISYVPAK
jgi:biopolymer transport protein ExbD